MDAADLLLCGFGLYGLAHLVPDQARHRGTEDNEDPGVYDGVDRYKKKGYGTIFFAFLAGEQLNL